MRHKRQPGGHATPRPTPATVFFQTPKEGPIMHTKLTASLLVAGLFLLPAAGQADDTDKSAASDYVKESMITTKIKAALATEKVSSLVKINVTTDDAGMVTLSGTTRTQADADRAEAIAKGVKGVTAVKNDIMVAPSQ
jgi:hyperosmotically inducible protein